jgi:hypothetical protein
MAEFLMTIIIVGVQRQSTGLFAITPVSWNLVQSIRHG